jgi:hypothetical protein
MVVKVDVPETVTQELPALLGIETCTLLSEAPDRRGVLPLPRGAVARLLGRGRDAVVRTMPLEVDMLHAEAAPLVVRDALVRVPLDGRLSTLQTGSGWEVRLRLGDVGASIVDRPWARLRKITAGLTELTGQDRPSRRTRRSAAASTGRGCSGSCSAHSPAAGSARTGSQHTIPVVTSHGHGANDGVLQAAVRLGSAQRSLPSGLADG